jgi:TolB-like protein/Tfp pilus assembly protein PilF
MTPARFQTVEQIFLAALEQEPDQISAFLDTACNGDAALRREVEALLASDQRAGRFIERSAVGLATKIIENGQARLLVGETIGHYEISKLISTGGMGEVYLATDIVAGRKAALKLLPFRFTGDAERLKRFQQEARAVVGLNHPNIVTVYEIGEHRSIHYIAGELIEGETLRERLTHGPMQLSEAVDVAIQVASALAAAHHAGIVHRDVKPENIMLRPDGYVKVLDFGIAKLAESAFASATADRAESMTLVATNLGAILGTVRYMSPEQACPDAVGIDKRTDIWSLGVVFYEMIAGHAPFSGDTPKEVMSSILEKEPPALTRYIARAPAELQQIVSKMLRKDRAQRYRSAHELLNALKDLRRKLEFESFSGSGFFDEVKRRKVYRVAAAYIIVAAGIIQLASAALPAWELPNWALRLVIVLLLVGFPLALILGWVFDLTSQGIRVTPGTHRRRNMLMLVAAGVIISAAAGFLLIPRVSAYKVDKSIAVLPFDNLSGDPDNAYFAEGIQEEILTHLAKVADLKVISRTSTQRYQSKPRNLTEIAEQLGVANIVEGSVQKVADQVRVNVQLLNAQTDSHIWAETYDRKLTDIFGVESEIAKGIAESLQAKLTSDEKQALAVKPTNNPEAYDAYLRGLAFEARSHFSIDNLMKAIGFYERAVELDPKFALGWARLSRADAILYFTGADTTAARRDAAKSALDNAQKLQPNSPETLLALGYYQYWVLRDYGLAKTTFKRVQKMLPGSSDVLSGLGAVSRREGEWDQSVAYFEQALALDPRNVELLNEAALTYVMLRQFPAALKLYDRALDIVPDNPDLMASKAGIYQAEGNLEQAAKFLAEIDGQTPYGNAFVTKFTQLRLERNLGEAIRLLQARLAQFHFASELERCMTQVTLAIAQRLAGDSAGAKTNAEQARGTLDPLCKNQPDNYMFAGMLSLANAALGEKDSAFKEAERAIALLPSAKDPMYGPGFEENLAVIQTMFGANSKAISTLTRLLQTPYYSWFYSRTAVTTPALLRLDPLWDPLRGDPRFQQLAEENAPLPEKSIAVLPFENLSYDPENAFFADGVQDEILTDLARVADLKVIGRTSVMQYKSGVARDLREIGRQLGVAHLVEGSVQRSGNRVRVNAQLVNARTDRRLWGQTYDRDVEDVFAMQSEIAKTIAEQLQAKLSPSEENAIARAPARDITAFDLYTRGKNLTSMVILDTTVKANLLQAVDLLNQAVARDPSFFHAYCELGKAHDYLYFMGYDHTSARLALAEAAIQAAFRLRPDAGEMHLARALNLYHGYLKYDSALAELKLARQTLPNAPRIFELTGYIQRRQGRWEESTRNLKRAIELDPRNVFTLQETANSYQYCRLYAEEKSLLDRVLSIVPNDVATKVALAFVEFNWKADTGPLYEVIDSIVTTQPGALSRAASYWLMCALAERDTAAANTALIALGENPPYLGVNDNVVSNRAFVEGVIARMTNQDDNTRSAFTAARAEQEKVVQAQPNYGPALCVLGLIDAALGRKEEALQEGRRAVELLPVEKNALDGNMMVKYLAMIAALVGDKDLACEQLATAIRLPSDLSYGQLKLLPYWDSLRGDPRFEKLLEDSKKPVMLK